MKKTETITVKVLGIANEYIPNRTITANASGPPLITSELKRYIRIRAFLRAKETKTDRNLRKFKKLQNKTVRWVRKCKTDFNQNLANKLKSDSLVHFKKK